ncbi:MAG: hypothetical protein K0S00_1865 [Xanthobacteraceae bacterium]|jgi:hypothetical protein|nr:hypothetical protein [Xanthobacteraceae bacterium]
MSRVLTMAAAIACPHGGMATITSGRSKLTVDGSPVLTAADLVGASFLGCTNAGPGLVPCKTIVSVVAGLSARLLVDGQPVLLDTATGLTDGLPGPFPWTVRSAGQTKLEAE